MVISKENVVKSWMMAMINCNCPVFNWSDFPQELSLRMEKLTDESRSKRHQLDHEMTQTLTSQIELDKTAEDFRKAHAERQNLISQWEMTIEQMQKRDREMDMLAAVSTSYKRYIDSSLGSLRLDSTLFDFWMFLWWGSIRATCLSRTHGKWVRFRLMSWGCHLNHCSSN